jgi:amino acid transporter
MTPFVNPAPESFNMNLLGSFGVALVASLWAFKGWEGSTYSAGEIKRPERNLPVGILAAVFISMNSLIHEFRNAIIGLVIILLGAFRTRVSELSLIQVLLNGA